MKSYTVDVVQVDTTSALPSCSSPSSFGLPSLTEDEREAIDSIVEAVNAARLSPEIEDCEIVKSLENDDVFYDDKIKDARIQDVEVVVHERPKNLRLETDQNLVDKEEMDSVIHADSTVSPPNTPAENLSVINNIQNVDTVKKFEVNTVKPILARSQSYARNSDVVGPIEKYGRRLSFDGTEIFSFAINPIIGEEARKRIEASLESLAVEGALLVLLNFNRLIPSYCFCFFFGFCTALGFHFFKFNNSQSSTNFPA